MCVCRYITGIHFTQKACPFLRESFENNFPTSNYSNSEVNFEVSESLPDCALPVPERGITFLQMDERCGRSIVAEEISLGLTFEPKCLVVVIRPDHRKALFDEMLAAGRNLADPLEISVNYTVGLHSNPDVPSIESNCQNSLLMQENYEADKILQAEFTRLEQVREKIEKVTALKNLLEYANSHQRFFQSPSPPPPPPLPLSPEYPAEDIAAGRLSPPGPPVRARSNPPTSPMWPLSMSPPPCPGASHGRAPLPAASTGHRGSSKRGGVADSRGVRLRGDEDERMRPLGDRRAESMAGRRRGFYLSRVQHIVGALCRHVRVTISRLGFRVPCLSCTRPLENGRVHDNVPPYPIGRYWDAASNPDGAPFDEKLELLKAGPWCYKDEAGTETVECPSKADRTQRSGIWENKVCPEAAATTHTTHSRLTPTRTRVSSCACRGGVARIDFTAATTSSAHAWCPTNPAFYQKKTAAKSSPNATKRATWNVVSVHSPNNEYAWT